MKRQPVQIQTLFKLMIHWQGKHFTLAELLYSEDGEAANLANLPTSAEISLLARLTTEVLDKIREKWDAPIYVNSGFRDPQVNDLAGGVDNSSHLCSDGAAVDIRPANATETNVKGLYRLIAESSLTFDQLILYDGRIHVGWRPLGNRRELRYKITGTNKEPLLPRSELLKFPKINGSRA